MELDEPRDLHVGDVDVADAAARALRDLRAALAEMARVVKRDGLLVIVDSIQKGDRPDWDGLLDLFPHHFHEPYYADYVGSRLEDAGADLGLSLVSTERAFLSKVVAWQK